MLKAAIVKFAKRPFFEANLHEEYDYPNQSDKTRPRHQGLHLSQEGVAPRRLPVLLEARHVIRTTAAAWLSPTLTVEKAFELGGHLN